MKISSKLTILRETIKTDNEINILIARAFIKKRFRNIGVLGLSYKGNLKVSILSPIIPFVKEIKKNYSYCNFRSYTFQTSKNQKSH